MYRVYVALGHTGGRILADGQLSDGRDQVKGMNKKTLVITNLRSDSSKTRTVRVVGCEPIVCAYSLPASIALCVFLACLYRVVRIPCLPLSRCIDITSTWYVVGVVLVLIFESPFLFGHGTSTYSA